MDQHAPADENDDPKTQDYIKDNFPDVELYQEDEGDIIEWDEVRAHVCTTTWSVCITLNSYIVVTHSLWRVTGIPMT